MATYIIGDVQGCLRELEQLLKKISYNSAQDTLGFVGDLVNRGPHSLDTLRFIKQLDNPLIVLGNHDLNLIALYYSASPTSIRHNLQNVLDAHDADELIAWLKQQPLMLHNQAEKYVMVHAGIPPQWSITQTQQYALEAQQQLQSEQVAEFLSYMYTKQPTHWDQNFTSKDRFRYTINALTRMRFCDATGHLDLTNKLQQSQDPNYKPWFEWIQSDIPIIFGHWAALSGQSSNPHCITLDTGCVWGGHLTAMRIEDQQLFSVPSQQVT